MEKMRMHCCGQMERYLVDQRLPVSYSPIFREYHIKLVNSELVKQRMFFCPWCGKKLPESLRDEYFAILEERFGQEPTLDIEENEKIPQEFKSDLWWKMREKKKK